MKEFDLNGVESKSIPATCVYGLVILLVIWANSVGVGDLAHARSEIPSAYMTIETLPWRHLTSDAAAETSTIQLLPADLVYEWTQVDGLQETTRLVHLIRTDDAVWLRVEGEAREWYLRKDRIDPLRIHGYLVDHERGALVSLDEEGWCALGVFHWTQLALPGLDSRDLVGTRLTGNRDYSFGLAFCERRSTSDLGESLQIWWSSELGAALFMMRSEGERRESWRLSSLRSPAAGDPLEAMLATIPEYTVEGTSLELTGIANDHEAHRSETAGELHGEFTRS